MEAWLQGGRSGHCGVTEERSGDCAADDQGSTPLTAEAASSLRTAALECGGYCLACERCRFITVSPDARDCSWYRACDRLEGSSEHHTLLVDNASAHLRERMRPSPLRLPLPGVPVLPRAQRSTSRGAKHPCATTVVSLVVYESSRWVDALLTNLFAHAEECTCAVLHLNSGSSYGTDVMAEWRSRRRVAVNRHRVPVMRGHGGILYAHVLNAIEARVAPRTSTTSPLQSTRRGLNLHHLATGGRAVAGNEPPRAPGKQHDVGAAWHGGARAAAATLGRTCRVHTLGGAHASLGDPSAVPRADRARPLCAPLSRGGLLPFADGARVCAALAGLPLSRCGSW